MTRGGAQLTKVCGWFPSTEMLVNHARGLVKVLTDAEKKRAFPYGCGVPPALLLVWAMREATLSDSLFSAQGGGCTAPPP